MIIIRSSRFKKQYKKLPEELKDKLSERIKIFAADEFDQILNNHMLKYDYEGYRSINLNGDWRIVYKKLDKQTYLLHEVGTHHQLFGK